MTTPEYTAALSTESWRNMSQTLRSNGCCWVCEKRFAPNDLQLHHLHYETLGREDAVLDVLVLCPECHSFADSHRRLLIDAAKGAGSELEWNWREVLAFGAILWLRKKLCPDPRSRFVDALEAHLPPGV